MRILQLTTWYRPSFGGVELHVKRLTDELRKQECEVTVMTLTPDSVDAVSFRGVVLPGVPLGYGILTSPSMYRAVLDSGADVVHAHAYGWPMGWVGYAAKKIRNLPFVFTTHSNPTTPVYPLRDVGRAISLMAADAVIATTAAEAVRLRKVGVEERKLSIIPNGIDEPLVVPRVVDGPYILCLGRVEFRSKGQDILVRAFAHGGFGEKLVFAGEGPDLRKLRMMVAGNPKVEVLGAVDEHVKASLLAHADLVVIPSRVEPFGIVGLEAVSYGRRIVATKVGGLQHILESYAVLAEPDASDIEHAMKDALSREPVKPRTDFYERYSWRSVAARTLEIYKEVSRSGS